MRMPLLLMNCNQTCRILGVYPLMHHRVHTVPAAKRVVHEMLSLRWSARHVNVCQGTLLRCMCVIH